MDKLTDNTINYKEITNKDLPLSCPMTSNELWNYHPRVFLPIEKEENKIIVCPYCSTKYKLT